MSLRILAGVTDLSKALALAQGHNFQTSVRKGQVPALSRLW